MQIETKDKDLSALLALYNREIDTLKSRLLSGASWEELAPNRRNITELAIAIHRSHDAKTPDYINAGPSPENNAVIAE